MANERGLCIICGGQIDRTGVCCTRCGAPTIAATGGREGEASSPWNAPPPSAADPQDQTWSAQPGAATYAPQPGGAPYPQQPGAVPYPYQPGAPTVRYVQQQTNGLAVASLVLSLVGLCGIGSVLAIIFGKKARREIRNSQGAQSGDGLARAGIIIGYIGVVILVLWILLYGLLLLGGTASTKYEPVGHLFFAAG